MEDIIDQVAFITASLEARLCDPKDRERAEALADVLATTQARIEERQAGIGFPPASVMILRRLGVSRTEELVIWLLVSVALRRDVRALLAVATSESGNDPTLEGIRQIIYGALPTPEAFNELSANGKLRRLGILQRTDGGDNLHESRQTWTIARRVLTSLLGDLETDPALAPFTINRPVAALEQLAIPERDIVEVCVAIESAQSVVVVEGGPGSGRRTVLECVAQPGALLVVDARKLGTEVSQLRERLRQLALECLMHQKTPLLCNLDAIAEERGEQLGAIVSILGASLDGQILVTCRRRPIVDWGRPVVVIELGRPTHAQHTALWRSALDGASAENPGVLAARYPLAPSLISQAAAAARAHASGRQITSEDVARGIRTVLDDRLVAYAKRVTVTQTWADLVMPSDLADPIKELIARVRGRHQVYDEWGFGAKVGRGLGVTALFSGPPGTGKTMVAGLIGKDLQLEVYQVDMAKVVSKYIGETEKNLAALFDAAEAGHAILLFDEADALFGKRTDVKSSNDRYANLETNYLLQRLESFTGICLLTSNHESNMDPAFQRRLSLHVRFALPEPDERAKMWRTVIPDAAPIASNVDYKALARKFEMSGGHIRNAALRAAFLAANQGTPITTALLESAARTEYEAMGKLAE
ncbi:MAG: ATP-binding protein [Deltaproteobacteria bacterium]|nr:ATP-binding protein [Deltaproteobacteria bacterium]